MMKLLYLVSVVGVLIAGLATANIRRNSLPIGIDWRIIKEPAVQVRVESPTRGVITRKITAPGTVEPIEEAKISSQVLGRVVAVHVKEGQLVKANDILVKEDDTDARARLSSSQARSERLRAAIHQAETELAKLSRDEAQHGRLSQRGYSTPTELADARSLVAKAEAALQMAKRDYNENEALKQISIEELKRTEIRSPIDGVVTDLKVAVGEVVIPSSTNLPGTFLMNVSDLAHMRVSAEVDESDVPLITPGQKSRIFLQFDERTPILSTVEKVAPKGRKTGDAISFETRVRVEQPPPMLRAGMSATVEIDVRRVENSLGVPVQAVVHRRRRDLPNTQSVKAWVERNSGLPGERSRDPESQYVKVVLVLEDGLARARPVETGISDERYVEIVSGLEAEDRVIVGPFRALDEVRDGQIVEEISDTDDG